MIRILAENDAETFMKLRRAALLDAPLAFASSPEDPRAADLEGVRASLRQAPESAVFGYFEDALLGLVGLYRDPHVKAAYKAHLWGMYVAPVARRRGIARGLLEAVVAHAEALPGIEMIHLGVTDAAPAAKRLYEEAGFVAWGREPDSLRLGEESTDEWHMIKRLDPSGR